MFTFGREHEKKCALAYIHDPRQAFLLLAVVDAVHDLIEGKKTAAATLDVFRRAFVEGKSGIWESTGTWIRKTAGDYPELISLWEEFASHTQWKVRFRAACFLEDMPSDFLENLGKQLGGQEQTGGPHGFE
jgi:hypothetical protein